MKSEDFVERFGRVLSIPLKPFLKVSKWAIDYTGFGAEFVKPIPVLLMLVVISHPLWSFPMWLMLAHSVTRLWQYVIYVLWIIQLPFILWGGAFVGYYIAGKSTEPDYRKVWDVEKSVKEYTELLEELEANKR
jgi:hypothetical protein